MIFESVLIAVISFLAGYFIQKFKGRSQVITHHCRISNQDVYTYFDSSNNPSLPACVYFAPNGDCKYPWHKPDSQSLSILGPEAAVDLPEIHRGKCYLSHWNK